MNISEMQQTAVLIFVTSTVQLNKTVFFYSNRGSQWRHCIVFFHKFPYRIKNRIFHASQSLIVDQDNLCLRRKHVLTIIFGVKKFHDYLLGKKFYQFQMATNLWRHLRS